MLAGGASGKGGDEIIRLVKVVIIELGIIGLVIGCPLDVSVRGFRGPFRPAEDSHLITALGVDITRYPA